MIISGVKDLPCMTENLGQPGLHETPFNTRKPTKEMKQGGCQTESVQEHSEESCIFVALRIEAWGLWPAGQGL